MNALRLYRALVIETNDPNSLGRVKLRTLRPARGARRRREGWASVANYPIAATFVLKPPYSVGDEVLYAAEKFPFTGAVVMCLRQRSAAAANLPLTLDTGNGNSLTLDASAGEVQVTTSAGQRLTLEANGSIAILAASQLKLQTSQLIVTASTVRVDATESRFSGLVRCETLLTNSVIASSYTPGAGNIW